MKLISQNKSKAYAPTTAVATEAASRFIERHNAWSEAMAAATSDLSGLLKANVSEAARGFLANDPLNMSAFGIVFNGNPGAGFIAVPSTVADRLNDQGLRGNAYFPDVGTPLGREVMVKLNVLSSAAEQRPMMNSVPGVSAVAIDNGRVVLTRAKQTVNGPVVLAAPAAVGPSADLAEIRQGVAARVTVEADSSAAQVRTQKMKM